MAGLGGALYTHVSLGVVSSSSYGLATSIEYVAAVVIGGLASLPGSVLGALYLTFDDELLSFLLDDRWRVTVRGLELLSVPSPLARIDHPERLRPVLSGTLLIVLVMRAPSGLAAAPGAARRRLRRLTARRRR